MRRRSANPAEVVDRAFRSLLQDAHVHGIEGYQAALTALFETLGGVDMEAPHLKRITNILAASRNFVADPMISGTCKMLVATRGDRPWPQASVQAVHAQFKAMSLAPYYAVLICESLGMPPK